VLRVFRPFDDYGSRRRRFREQPCRKIVQGGQHELFKLLLQGDAIPADGRRRSLPEARVGFAGRQP
jgi:hypothetical protein